MDKAFENILERIDSYIEDAKSEGDFSYIKPFEIAKIAVQEVAEEYKDGWIPCNERLPEECIEVLVSIKEIDDSFYTSTSWVQDGVWVIKKTPLQPTVIAWQPLPEPYKESD